MNTEKYKRIGSFKRSALTKAILPILTTTIVSGCMNTDPENSGLYEAGENEVVVYYKRDVAAAITSGSTYDGWGLHLWNGDGCTSTDLIGMGLSESGTNWEAPYEFDGISDTYG
ncbi:pullulanase-associated domain-containing protein, partial [Vibrio splendidus]